MTRFIRRLNQKDDRIIYVTGLHWIQLVKAAAWLAGLLVLGMALDSFILKYAGDRLFTEPVDLVFIRFYMPFHPMVMFCGVIGTLIAGYMFLKFWGTEIGVSHKNVIFKTGVIMVDVSETAIEEIRGEDIDHGIWGSILDYGCIHLDCRFIEDVQLPRLKDPYKFVRALDKARSFTEKEDREEDFPPNKS